MAFASEMVNIKRDLEALGHKVILPRNTEKYADGSLEPEKKWESSENKVKYDLFKHYYNEIQNSDAILVVNI